MAASSSRSIPLNIYLDDSPFTKPDICRQLINDGRQALADGVKSRGQQAFIEYARKVMVSCEQSSINSFHLRFSNPGDYIAHANEWIRVAGRTRSVMELDLDFSDVNLHDKFPEGNNACAELVSDFYDMYRSSLDTLKLTGCNFDPAKLKEYKHLHNVIIARIAMEDEMLQELIKNCDHLEDLSLIRLTSLYLIRIADEKGALKRLTIEHCHSEDTGLVEIEARNLKYFKYFGRVKLFTIEAPRVEEAVFDFSSEENFTGDEGCLLSGVISSFVTAKEITVCSYTIQVLPHGDDPLRLSASNQMLRHLILKKVAMHPNELPGVVLLLRSYPELENLTVTMDDVKQIEGFTYPFDNRPANAAAFWALQITTITCLNRHLKKVTVQGFKGTANELAFLKFLLRKSNVLKDMILEVASDGNIENRNRYMGLAQTLHGLNNASPDVTTTIR
ncbi:F-box protein At3g62230-like [Dioscorea cayenensis subsp. rotundata]|uniref:F-box protein At3g62230-like n=1 Tax=Dioscorea cayennensis subsp. rotundata TaxID=55577 RepID=A0AB40BZV2_DIOCR|nr:F-box protein At3g62230-like [Dioscorea cayenensis subsp. rotundata]